MSVWGSCMVTTFFFLLGKDRAVPYNKENTNKYRFTITDMNNFLKFTIHLGTCFGLLSTRAKEMNHQTWSSTAEL